MSALENYRKGIPLGAAYAEYKRERRHEEMTTLRYALEADRVRRGFLDRPRTAFALDNAQGAYQHLNALVRGWDSFADDEKKLGVEAALACLESSFEMTHGKKKQ